MESVSPESAYARRLWSRFETHVPSERPDEGSEQEQDWSAVEEEGADALSLPATAEEAGDLAVAVRQRDLACADECVQRLEEHIEALNRRRFFEAWNEGIERYENGGRKAVQSRIDALEEAIADYHSDLEDNLDLQEALRDVRKRARAHVRAGRGDRKGDSGIKQRPSLALLFSCMTWDEVMREWTWNEILERTDELLSEHEEEKAKLSRLQNEIVFRYNVLTLLLNEDVSGEGLRRVVLPTDEPDPETVQKATETQLEHLHTARKVLLENPAISNQEDFFDACEDRNEPGDSVRKRVQELGKNLLGKVHLPPKYSGFGGGFQQLVEDLWAGEVAD